MNKLVVPVAECKSKCINDISTLMENEFFRSFFDKYMSNWQDIETVIMFMKVYEAFEKTVLPMISPINKMEKKRILSLMTERSINDYEFRKNICTNMDTFTKGNTNLKLVDFQRYLKV